MPAETVLDVQGQLSALSDTLFSASATDPQRHQADVYSVIAKADDIYSTAGLPEDIAVEAAYLLLNGLRVSRQYMFTPNRERTKSLLVSEHDYRKRIEEYDRRRNEN